MVGDRCDPDKDGDGLDNDVDNCPKDDNPLQEDVDLGGVGDACDACSGTEPGAVVDRSGCSNDQACPCEADEDGNPWKNHGRYVRCVVDEAQRFRLNKLIDRDEAAAIKVAAAATECGRREPTCL